MTALPPYDLALWACPLCRFDSQFCICSTPEVPAVRLKTDPRVAASEKQGACETGLDRAYAAVRIVRSEPEITAPQMADRLGLCVRSAHRYLGAMQRAGLLERPAKVPDATQHTPQPREEDSARMERLKIRDERRKMMDAERATRVPSPSLRAIPTCICGKVKAEHPRKGCPGWWETGL